MSFGHYDRCLFGHRPRSSLSGRPPGLVVEMGRRSDLVTIWSTPVIYRLEFPWVLRELSGKKILTPSSPELTDSLSANSRGSRLDEGVP